MYLESHDELLFCIRALGHLLCGIQLPIENFSFIALHSKPVFYRGKLSFLHGLPGLNDFLMT